MKSETNDGSTCLLIDFDNSANLIHVPEDAAGTKEELAHRTVRYEKSRHFNHVFYYFPGHPHVYRSRCIKRDFAECWEA